MITTQCPYVACGCLEMFGFVLNRTTTNISVRVPLGFGRNFNRQNAAHINSCRMKLYWIQGTTQSQRDGIAVMIEKVLELVSSTVERRRMSGGKNVD